MKVTRSNGPKSTVLLEVELPPERLQRAVGQATSRLGRRTRVPGFRPGKAPRAVLERVLGPGAILDDAVEHLVEDAYREALIDQVVLPLTNAEIEVVTAEEGRPLVFKASVPVRPDVELGDYRGFTFSPTIEETTDERIDRVTDELRDQYATLVAVEDRGAANGDYAVIGFTGSRDGVTFDGGSAERMPLVLGEERLIPGFEGHLVGLSVGDRTEFDITFPEDYGEASLAGQTAHFAVELKELRQRILPPLDDDFAAQLGAFDSVEALRADIRSRLERNALDRARHEFADRIIEYAVANATIDLPDVLVEQETEVMHDELRSSLARQGISEEAWRQATGKSESELHDEFRPSAERRVKTLLVLSKIAETEGVDIPDAAIEAEVARARARYADQPRLVRYFESERGRNFIRSTLRRSALVEQLVDEWLAAHPEHPALPHAEDDAGSPVDEASVQAAASIEATDPGSVLAEDESPADASAVDVSRAGAESVDEAEPATATG
jgi:trigger factor